MARHTLVLEELEGIVLPKATAEQNLIQYVNDADMMVKGTEGNCH